MTDIIRTLEAEREYLLDLSTRTRLLSTPRHSGRRKLIEVIDELSDEVFGILARTGQSMSFLPAVEAKKENAQEDLRLLLAPPDDDVDEDGIAKRHKDSRLQTEISPEKLQLRLRQLQADSRTAEEEQGVNILYLALGFLNWTEQNKPDKTRSAPLILLPAFLERKSARAQFRLTYSGEELLTNISLQLKLEKEWGISLPDLPDGEDLIPSEYLARVAAVVSDKEDWSVEENGMVLGLFSFAKFLMYRDLDEDNWPASKKLSNHPLLGALLGDGFQTSEELFGEDDFVDDLIDPGSAFHVLDADSSQTLAIEEISKGRHFVIQGPPGTGKSQTIANVIATSVQEGKKVLFLAEKRVALDVVKRRLDQIGLGEMCLELHSHKARKKEVLGHIQQALSCGRPRVEDVETTVRGVRRTRDTLNSHAKLLNTPIGDSGVTPIFAMGSLLRLKELGCARAEVEVDVKELSRQRVENLRAMIRVFQDHATALSAPNMHPWRGVRRFAMLPADVTRVIELAKELQGALPDLRGYLDKIRGVSGLECNSERQTAAMVRWGEWIKHWPGGDHRALSSQHWPRSLVALSELVTQVQKLTSLRRALEGRFHDDAWSEDLGLVRRTLSSYDGSWFRFLSSEYRAAQRTLRGLSGSRRIKGLKNQIRVLESLESAKNLIEEIVRANSLGHEAFGDLWKGDVSDSRQLRAILHWFQSETWEHTDVMATAAAKSVGNSIVINSCEVVGDLLPPFKSRFEKLVEQLDLDTEAAFGSSELDDVDFEILENRIDDWINGRGELPNWTAYYVQCQQLREAGVQSLVDLVDSGTRRPSDALNLFETSYYEALLRNAWETVPELASFNGRSHSAVLQDFQMLDVDRIKLARRQVALAHWNGIPRGNSQTGELGIVFKETQKKFPNLPIRRLLELAGRAVQATKPVFMMSPMSIAQYLTPGAIEFDVLVIDEASQVRPVDALGAVARTDQLVVVGDDKQLPPTAFFSSLIMDKYERENNSEDERTGDFESILKLCAARGMPSRMLRWHYRSRHGSLIAVSNKCFYKNRLFIVPSPEIGYAAGLKFHFVEDGVYDRGRSARNENEAEAVVRATIEHARLRPAVSLGVVAFSVQQRDAILDYLELYRREHPETEEFFREGAIEPFFVKNLESVQGDERDVIMISIGFGPDSSGYFSMNFGPVSNSGGERRLNVLITRARERCEIFSSIRAHDIDLARVSQEGPVVLKTYLQFAESGVMDIAVASGRDAESPFEEQVERAVTDLGWDVDRQVGTAGFFVDLAVKDRQNPGRYVLGIECDGATYHSSRSARDRDRLRQRVLEDRGWKIHRVWSTDWFQDPEGELRKVLASLNQSSPPGAGARSSAGDEIERDDGLVATELESAPYVEAKFGIPYDAQPDAIAPYSLLELAKRVVEVEEPIHKDEIARRLACLWGLGRTGRRIASAVETALSLGASDSLLKTDGNFFWISDGPFRPRVRSAVASDGLSKPSMIPPMEIREGVLMVIRSQVGLSAEEAASEVVKLFGFRRTGASLKDLIIAEIRNCIGDGVISIEGDQLRLPVNH